MLSVISTHAADVSRGMDDFGGGKMVRAFVPLAEMFGYSTDLRSKTQGRGNYSMFFDKYEQVPKSVQEKVLAEKTAKIRNPKKKATRKKRRSKTARKSHQIGI